MSQTSQSSKIVSALEQIGKLPKVGFGFGTDFGLGTCHNYALDIARETLQEATSEKFREIGMSTLMMFDNWRDENGVYPPHRQSLSGLLLGAQKKEIKQTSAKEYCETLYEQEDARGEEPKLPAAWECCNEASNPIELFEKLLAEEYPPLFSILEKHWQDLPIIWSLLILITDGAQNDHKSSDCIRIAFKINSFRLRKHQKKISELEPHRLKEENRKQKQKEVLQTQKDNTRKDVLDAYNKLKEMGVPFNQKRIAEIAQVTVPTVSKYLKESGINSKRIS